MSGAVRGERSDAPASSAGLWIAAARPKTLWAAAVPVVIGTAMALGDGFVHWPAALAALVGALLIQIGTNYANDYSDFVNGADTEERQGPLRVTQAGLVSPTDVRNAAVLMFVASAAIGAYLIWRGGLPVLLIGVLSILSGWLYTGGPRPFGYMGLGDLFVLVFFGPVAVGGTYYVQALHVTPSVLIAGLAPGLLSVAILVVNNLRDIEQDARAGKRTLAVRFGRRFARWQYATCVCGAVAIPVAMAFVPGGKTALLICLLALAPALPGIRRVFRLEGRALNPMLGKTAQILLIYSLLFSAGWTLGA